jgi:hypothetical protein
VAESKAPDDDFAATGFPPACIQPTGPLAAAPLGAVFRDSQVD